MPNMTPTKNHPVIVCEHVSVGYGREEVLHDVCLRVGRGAFLPVVGPNGAGKTTLVRAILGLVKTREGRIITPFHRRPPGYVPQYRAIDPLYPVSARQVVMMGVYPKLGCWGRRRSVHRKAVDVALERFDLSDHAEKTFAELSGGMKQKVMVARAFVSGAEIFIMDEPTSELDEQSEKEVLAHLHRLSEVDGKTVLLVHHGLGLVAELASEVCLVDHGRIRTVTTENAHSLIDSAAFVSKSREDRTHA